jgi:hypothetical protein
VREFRTHGSVRGAPSNGRPYRDHSSGCPLRVGPEAVIPLGIEIVASRKILDSAPLFSLFRALGSALLHDFTERIFPGAPTTFIPMSEQTTGNEHIRKVRLKEPQFIHAHGLSILCFSRTVRPFVRAKTPSEYLFSSRNGVMLPARFTN